MYHGYEISQFLTWGHIHKALMGKTEVKGKLGTEL